MGTSTGNKFGSCCHSQAIKFLYLPCANCLCKQNYFNDWINSVLFARARHAGCTARGPSPPVHCFILFHLVSSCFILFDSRPIYARTSSFIWFHLVSSCFILFHFVSSRPHLRPYIGVSSCFILFHLVSSRFILFHLFHLGGRRARQPCAEEPFDVDGNGDAQGDFGPSPNPGQDEMRCSWNTDHVTPCGELFDSMGDFVEHVNQHVNAISNRHFACRWSNCKPKNGPFKARYKLINHVRVHTGEQPFICSECNKRLARSENRKIHIRLHTSERPFECPYTRWKKKFTTSSDRTKQTVVHTGERGYVCKQPGCDKGYMHPSSLRKHISTCHKHATAQTDP